MSDFRARSNTEILDAAFELYRRYFPIFFTIGIVATLPSVIALYLGTPATAITLNSLLTINGACRILSAFIYPFSEAAIIAATSSAYLNSSVDLTRAVRTALARPVQVLASVWATLLLLGIGFVLFIVPAFIVFKRYFAIPATVVLENRSVGSAMKRSRQLSNGNGKRIFALLGSVILFLLIISIMLGGLIASSGMGALSAIVELVVLAALNPFAAIVATLLYYDIRIRREGYDIELMADAMDVAV